MNEQFRIIAQSYCGMTPKDKGCETWSEMQQKMADEIEKTVKISKFDMLDKFEAFQSEATFTGGNKSTHQMVAISDIEKVIDEIIEKLGWK